MDINFKPLGPMVLVIPDENKRSMHGSIFLIAPVRDKTTTATVISVGLKVEKKNSVKLNDKILFIDGSGDEIEIDGKEYILINENRIEAVI